MGDLNHHLLEDLLDLLDAEVVVPTPSYEEFHFLSVIQLVVGNATHQSANLTLWPLGCFEEQSYVSRVK